MIQAKRAWVQGLPRGCFDGVASVRRTGRGAVAQDDLQKREPVTRSRSRGPGRELGSVPARRKGVTVLPARMLAGYLGRRKPVISAEEARALHARLVRAVG